MQYRMGHGLPVLQHRIVALCPPDGHGGGIAGRHGAFFARAAAVAEGRTGRARRHPQADRRRAADRRAAQGIHHVRAFDDFAHRRIDHRHHRPAAGAAALRIAGHGSLHEAQGRGAAARHGGRRGGGADGRLVVASAFACLGQRDDHALRLRHGAVHGLVQSPGCQVPHHHRAALGILRGGRRCAALRAKGDHPHRLCRHSRPCAFPDALRADGADLSAEPDAELCAQERAGHGVEHLYLPAACAGDRHFGRDGAGQAACRYGGLRAGDLRRRGARAAFLLRAAPPSRSAGRAAALTRGGESGGIEQSGMRVGRTRGVPVSEFGGNEYRDGVLPECKKESLWLSFFIVR